MKRVPSLANSIGTFSFWGGFEAGISSTGSPEIPTFKFAVRTWDRCPIIPVFQRKGLVEPLGSLQLSGLDMLVSGQTCQTMWDLGDSDAIFCPCDHLSQCEGRLRVYTGVLGATLVDRF